MSDPPAAGEDEGWMLAAVLPGGKLMR